MPWAEDMPRKEVVSTQDMEKARESSFIAKFGLVMVYAVECRKEKKRLLPCHVQEMLPLPALLLGFALQIAAEAASNVEAGSKVKNLVTLSPESQR